MSILARGAGLWRRLRSWRRISFTRAGGFFTAGALAVGFAAINTGNNLLFLLLGAMLGAMAVSGWLSEQMLQKLEIVRYLPPGGHVGDQVPLRYGVRNRKRILSTFALELQEQGLPGRAFVGRVAAGDRIETVSRNTFLNRGIYPLPLLTLATEFPFGLFRKERDIPLVGELVVWPRVDLVVRTPSGSAGVRPRSDAPVPVASAGARGEYRGLREYRPGDDPRDIHWRSTARTGTPVIREYDRDASEALWISLDVTTPPGEDSERAADLAGSLAAGLVRSGGPVALHVGRRVVPAGSGPAQLERILDALARVDFGGLESAPPVRPIQCVRITAGPAVTGWADVILARTAPATAAGGSDRLRAGRAGANGA